MLIEPDIAEAVAEQDALHAASARRSARATGPGAPGPMPPPEHPAVFAAHLTRDPTARESAAELLARARAGAGRVVALGCPARAPDPAPPEPHLTRSLERALRQLPSGRGRPDVRLVSWDDRERQLLCAVCCLLARADPGEHAELTVVLRQVALVEGRGISGYTDFGVHGAVVVNRARLTDSADGLPARVRFAEALVHEGAHVRCNAAGWSAPYLTDPKDRAVLVETPLRPDPRPLNGLFQQFVVLARCVALYDRLLAWPGEVSTGERAAVTARRDGVRGQWRDATHALRRSVELLSARGRAEVEHAERLLMVGEGCRR